jgi:hypothetical protein
MTGNATAVIDIDVAAQRLTINPDLIVSSNGYVMTLIFNLANRFERSVMSSMTSHNWLTGTQSPISIG